MINTFQWEVLRASKPLKLFIKERMGQSDRGVLLRSRAPKQGELTLEVKSSTGTSGGRRSLWTLMPSSRHWSDGNLITPSALSFSTSREHLASDICGQYLPMQWAVSIYIPTRQDAKESQSRQRSSGVQVCGSLTWVCAQCWGILLRLWCHCVCSSFSVCAIRVVSSLLFSVLCTAWSHIFLFNLANVSCFFSVT